MRFMRFTTAVGSGVAALLAASAASAQPFECDNKFGQCGTPEMSGGGGGGAVLIANTDVGDTYQNADDYDNDGIEDSFDNCPRANNLDQADADGDGFGDRCDNCATTSNLDQLNRDGDVLGDVCDDDIDGDEIPNGADNCPMMPNPFAAAGVQPDLDGDGQGDACDDDIDGDGLLNLGDDCPLNPDPSASATQTCFPDADGDGISEIAFETFSPDVCPGVFDPEQADLDGDGVGDACDPDIDADGIRNVSDNCAELGNGDQLDADRDGLGDACDPRFCYVPFGSQANCLDPTADFAVFVPDMLMEPGIAYHLPVFANREDGLFSYTWAVVEAPTGSSATVTNARGELSTPTDFEFAYAGAAARFSPDVEGYYQLRLTVTAEVDEVTGEVGKTTSYLVDVYGEAGSSAGSGTCSAGGSGASNLLWVGLVVLGLAFGRRRRR